MKMKKVSCVIITAVLLISCFSFKALAEMKPGSVVIGNKAFSLRFANDKANSKTIIAAIQEANKNKGKVFIKAPNGMWFNNDGTTLKDKEVIPEVTYVEEDGSEVVYEKGDGDVANQEEFYVVDIF